MTDTEIINLFFKRSEQAIEELDKKHGSAVASVAARWQAWHGTFLEMRRIPRSA